MATYLQMVNRVLGLLRQPRVVSLVTPATVTQEVMDLVNRAARSVLEERNWNCLIRESSLRIPANVTGTGTGDVTTTRLSIPVAAITSGDLANGATRWHARVTSDALFGSLAIPVASFTTPALRQLAFEYTVNGLTTSAVASWQLYGNIGAFPTTFRSLMHVTDQERPLRLGFGDRYDLRRFEPDWSRLGQDPEIIFVGGQTSATFDGAGAAGATSLQYIVWPPPTRETLLTLDYVIRFADLTADASELAGIPAVLTDLIEIRAAVDGLYGTIANDPERGGRLEASYERGLLRAARSEETQTHRRRIPRPFGSGPHRDPWSDWQTRQVPSP